MKWTNDQLQDRRRRTGHEWGVYFLSNPVSGRDIDGSWRSEANVTSWRYAVIESDKCEEALWLRMIVQLYLPIVAVYSSGGKSIHSLVRIDANSKQEWDWIVKLDGGRDSLQHRLVRLGADPGCLSALWLTRLSYRTT